MMTSSSYTETLLDLAVRGRWSALAERAETHPDELARVGEDGTVFHVSCANDAPSRVLQALLFQDKMRTLRGYSRAVLIPDNNGITPLMIACQRAWSKEHVELLVKSAPELIPLTDSDGWNALHYTCHNSRHLAFGAIILSFLLSRVQAQNRELALQSDASGENTPLSLACETVPPGDSILDAQRGHNPELPLFFVRKMIHLILPQDMQSWPYVSKILSIPEIPLAFVETMLLTQPESSLLKMDNDGNTPLHFAVSRPWETGLVKLIVKACPSAATVRNSDGLLPLQLALATSNQHWDEDFYALVDANPASLEALELDDAIYPYVLARINNNTGADAVFRMLQSKPTLVRARVG